MSDTYFAYMVASNNRHALYIGVTNDLERRISEHRSGTVDGFAAHYHCIHLVCSESFSRRVRCHRPRKATQRLAPGEEEPAHRSHPSRLA